jgi:carbamoyltransferase
MNILGIAAYYHDSAAALVQDGKVVACAQEERFTRRKGDAGFPRNAVEYCLRAGKIFQRDVDYVVFYDKPYVKFHRLLSTFLTLAPRGRHPFVEAMQLWVGPKINLEWALRSELGGYGGTILFCEHHESHAASAFHASPFDEAAVVTVDGVGEWTTTAWGVGRGNTVDLRAELQFPHSLGLLYSAFTEYTGFTVNSGEYKVMGLAPYGEPKYVAQIYSHLIDLKADGSFRLNLEYFDFAAGLTMTNERFHRLFGGPPRVPESLLRQRDMDLARSIQVVTEEVMLRLTRHVHAQTGQTSLCMAGGVALNSVANGRILREGPYERLWVQPAASDAGGALGAALYVWHQTLGNARTPANRDVMAGGLLGPEFSEWEIERALTKIGARYHRVAYPDLFAQTAALLESGKVVGWFQGRMEFGPRALGARSILADPRSATMQKQLNLQIKFREGFRPFAPSVLAEDAPEYFDLPGESPYMLLVVPVAEALRRPMTAEDERLWGIEKLNVVRSSVPAVTHVDYSARVQTVTEDDNPLYYRLLRAWKERTGCSVLVNTSFNVRGEPIVCAPEDAYSCFMRTAIDVLAVGPFLLHKAEQPEHLSRREGAQMAGPLALD